MKISESWLREWVNPDISTDTLVEQLTMAGLEVDGTEAVAPDFSGVVVAQVETLSPHPDADKLRVCQVNDGSGDLKQVVCGAKNVVALGKYPFAQVGAVLPGNFKIKKAKLRGETSLGMLCAEQELGLAESSEGLLTLPSDAPVGQDIREYLSLDDTEIEVDLTPNRGDCLSVAGVAREVGVLNRLDVIPVNVAPVPPQNDDTLQIQVSAPEACPVYAGRVVKNVNVKASTPIWMVEKLRRSGIRSLGPVVDISNYVMLELGQPMHGFDLGSIDGGINVRFAEEGESLTLLDGQSVKLASDNLLIADNSKALALAGIMGGEGSGVSDETRDIFLEAAFFEPIGVAGKARKLGLHTDSSHRFERGVDPALPEKAIERATALLLEITGGEAGPTSVQISASHLPDNKAVTVAFADIERILGVSLPDDDVVQIFARLGFKPEVAVDKVTCQVPSYRFDIEIKEDLIEEIARIYGYDNIPVKSPETSLTMSPMPEGKTRLRKLRQLLSSQGFQETITYSFTDSELLKKLTPDLEPVVLANPIASDMSAMRTTLWAGLISAAQYNKNRQSNKARFFESGLKFVQEGDTLRQDRMLAGLMMGARTDGSWANDKGDLDFYDLKGVVEQLLQLGRKSLAGVKFEPSSHKALHPGQSASVIVDGQSVGDMGALNPALAKAFDLPKNSYLFELALSGISSSMVSQFIAVSKFPSTSRDLALLVDENVTYAQLSDCVSASGSNLLQSVQVFDVYQGKGIEKGKKSVAINLTICDPSNTLIEQDVDNLIENVIKSLKDNVGACLR